MNHEFRRGPSPRRTSRARWLQLLALGGALQAANACSVLLNDEPEQCSADADCSKRGFKASHCDLATRVCVADTGGAGGSAGSGSGGRAMNGGTGNPEGGTRAGAGEAGEAGQGGQSGGAGGGGGEGGGAGNAGSGGEAGGAPPDCGDKCGDPVGIRVIGATATKQIGTSVVGVDHTDVCPNDQVLVGLRVYLGTRPNYQFLQRARAVCGVLSLKGPAPYTLSIDAGASLLVRGSGFSDDEKLDRLCPANQIVVGYSGYSQTSGAQAIKLRCAPLSIEDTGDGYGVALGEISELEWAGPTATGTAVPVTDCPAGQVARGASMRVDAGISRLGITCAAPALSFPDGAPCKDASSCDSVRCERGFCLPSLCNAPDSCTCAPFDLKQFAFCKTTNSYYNAARICEETGFLLATVRSDAENGWLRSTATANGLTANVLLGGNDIGIEGRWVWPDRDSTQFWQGGPGVSGGASVNGRFTAWSNAEPNNASGDLDCVASFPDDHWAAQVCDMPSQFACSAN